MSSSDILSFDTQRHIRFFASALHQIPAPYAKLDTNRLTLVHFAVHALDLLNVWDNPELLQEYRLDKQRIIDWIYDCLLLEGGFQGGTYAGPLEEQNENEICTETPPALRSSSPYHRPHIAMTYCALLTLLVLDPLHGWDRLPDKSAILEHVRSLQRPDGSFGCIQDPSEQDMRFLYCACSISYLLNDWSGINVDRAVEYIQSCRAYDGGIALVPGQEGHGGSTFCGLAALVLMGRLDTLERKEELIHWCVHRQVQGMQGRPNKVEDTCYSYWIGGSLKLLGHDHLLEHAPLQTFILSCQSPQMGGFAKTPGVVPDILHSFYSLAWLCLSNNSNLPIHRLNASLGIRQDRVEQLQQRVGQERTIP